MSSSASSCSSDLSDAMDCEADSNKMGQEEVKSSEKVSSAPVYWLDYNGEVIYPTEIDSSGEKSDDVSFELNYPLPANLNSGTYEPSEIDSEESYQWSECNSNYASEASCVSVKPWGLTTSLHRLYGSQLTQPQPPRTAHSMTNDAIFSNLMAMGPWQPSHLSAQNQLKSLDSTNSTEAVTETETPCMVSCDSDAIKCDEVIYSDRTHETLPSHVDEMVCEQYCQQAQTDPNLNMPHPSLEYPPCYFFLKKWGLLDRVHRLYQIRWSLTYPLQKRVYTKGYFQKIGIFWTWGELLLLIPFIVTMILCIFFSFINPNITKTGNAARWPLLFCFPTGIRNSFLTLLLGMPYERAFWYHKLAGRIAFISAILHAIVAVGNLSVEDGTLTSAARIGDEKESVTVAGTLLFVCSLMMVATSLPSIRKKFYEIFFFSHVFFAAGCLICAFFHTHWLGPAIGLCFWGSDVFVRKIYMACARHTKTATVRVVSESVVELSFPKTQWFDYNPGQYIRLCVPDVSLWEWHPFYVSSCPQELDVTIHIRVTGDWTTALHKVATEKRYVPILFEGPYGSVALDMIMNDRYKMIMLLSGGIGVTPMQSLSNQLIFEYATKQRTLKKLCFVWMERDPMAVQNMDVTRKDSSIHLSIRRTPSEFDLSSSDDGDSDYESDSIESEDAQYPMGIASTLLTFGPPSRLTDSQLEQQLPSESLDRTRRSQVAEYEFDDSNTSSDASQDNDHERYESSDASSEHEDLENGRAEDSPYDVLDLNVFLTEGYSPSIREKYPFVYAGIPNVNTLFSRMREDAIDKGERRVAVCICAAHRLVVLCRKACVKYTDDKVRFDLHEEYYE